MTSLINASTSAGIVVTSDTSGQLALQSNGVTIATISSTGLSTQVGAPAFSAFLSANQTPITNATFTKIQANTEEFDTASCYDNATNYRFTPTVAGYYQVNGSVNITSSSNTEVLCVIYKNGSIFKWGNYLSTALTTADRSSVISALIYLNGTTDYVELYGYISGTGTLQFIGSQQRTYFQAAMVRSA